MIISIKKQGDVRKQFLSGSQRRSLPRFCGIIAIPGQVPSYEARDLFSCIPVLFVCEI